MEVKTKRNKENVYNSERQEACKGRKLEVVFQITQKETDKHLTEVKSSLKGEEGKSRQSRRRRSVGRGGRSANEDALSPGAEFI